MSKRDLLTLAGYKQDEIYRLLSLAFEFKRRRRAGSPPKNSLGGKSVALIFRKPSTRTRVSFETAVCNLGGHSLYMSGDDLQLDRGETMADTGQVLSRYVDAIVIRTYEHKEAQELADAASVPVINALTDLHHPCQALADLMTILEAKERLSRVKLAYIGDGNNVCNSLLVAAAKVGVDMSVASPKGYLPTDEIVSEARGFIRDMHKITVTDKPKEAAKDADVVYTDVWVSMGQDEESAKRLADFSGFQVNKRLMSLAKPDAIVMHCLPAHRGQEIAANVIDGSQSVVFEQAENRLYVQQALLTMLLGV